MYKRQITTLKEFDKNYDTNYDTKQVLQVATGIDKVSKEYTVILDTATPPTAIVGNVDPKIGAGDYTITVDDKALYYYVDEDGNITESSYSGIAVDENDRVYAVIEDNMVQMLVICEVPAEKDVYGVQVTGATNATVRVDGKTASVGDIVEYERNDEDVVITVTPASSYEFATAPVVTLPDGTTDTMTKRDDGSYTYTISRVRGLYKVNVTATKIPDATMDVFVTYVDAADGTTVVGTELVTGVTAESGKSYALLSSAANKALLTIPTDYEFASANTPVTFVANGYDTATVLVKQVKFNVSATTDLPYTGAKVEITSPSPLGTVGAGTEIVITYTDTAGGWNSTHETGWSVNADNAKIGAITATCVDAKTFTIAFTVTEITGTTVFDVDWS